MDFMEISRNWFIHKVGHTFEILLARLSFLTLLCNLVELVVFARPKKKKWILHLHQYAQTKYKYGPVHLLFAHGMENAFVILQKVVWSVEFGDLTFRKYQDLCVVDNSTEARRMENQNVVLVFLFSVASMMNPKTTIGTWKYEISLVPMSNC